jgi:hypothetical protein
MSKNQKPPDFGGKKPKKMNFKPLCSYVPKK